MDRRGRLKLLARIKLYHNTKGVLIIKKDSDDNGELYLVEILW